MTIRDLFKELSESISEILSSLLNLHIEDLFFFILIIVFAFYLGKIFHYAMLYIAEVIEKKYKKLDFSLTQEKVEQKNSVIDILIGIIAVLLFFIWLKLTEWFARLFF